MLMHLDCPLALQLPIAPSEIGLGILLPAAVSLTAMLLAWRPWNATARGHWAGGIAIGLGFSVGMVSLWAMPKLPPISAEEWLFYVGGLAALLGLLDGLVTIPRIFRYVLVVAASAMVVYLVLKIQHQWAARESGIWIAIATAAMVAGFVLLDAACAKLQNSIVPMLMTLAAAGLGLLMTFSGSQTDGQRAGILFATTAAIVPIAWWSKRLSLSRGGVLAFVMLFGGLLVTSYEYNEKVVPYRLMLIAASPVIGLLPVLTRLKGWKRWTACLLLAAIPLGIAIVPAGLQFVHDYNAPKDDYGY